MLFEFSIEVAANDESELLENAITPTKRLSSESEESKVEGDTSTCKKIKIEKETWEFGCTCFGISSRVYLIE